MNGHEQPDRANRPRLITMAHSHYSEVARWALDLAKVDYVEERHLPLLHRFHTTKAGGRSAPVLVAGASVHTESIAIIKYAAAVAPSAKLYPSDPILHQQSDQLAEYFSRELGPHARRWAYSELLGSVSLLNACVSLGVSRGEAWATPIVMHIARPLIRRMLRITPESAGRSLGIVHAVFARVGKLLADGRDFLVGDSPGIADVSFAALAAPVLLPPQFRGTLPDIVDVPGRMRDEVSRLRGEPAGVFALRLYERHR